MGGALLETLIWSAGLLLTIAGAVGAWVSGTAAKRVVGVLLGLFGAGLAASAFGAHALTMAALAAGFGYTAFGVALVVRLQESYAASDVRALDAADAAEEPMGR